MALTKIKTGSVSDSIGLTTPDINGGTIDATVIGGGTPAAATFTTASDASGNVRSGRKNLIINGDMRISQRGTSTTGITSSASGFFAADRVKFFNAGGVGPTYTVTQENNGVAGFSSSYKIQTTTADTSLPASHYSILRLGLIEGQDLLGLEYGTGSAKALTLSFWVKSNKTGSQTILGVTHSSMQQQNKQTFTINNANTWEKKEITFAGNTATAMTDITTMGLSIDILLAAGSSYRGGTAPLNVWGSRTSADKAVDTLDIASSTSDYFQITGVQLEVGSVATEFEHRSYGEELALCQRYYQTNNFTDLVMGNYSLRNAYVAIPLITTMRSAPTVVPTSSQTYSSGASHTDATLSSRNPRVSSLNFYVVHTSNIVQGNTTLAYVSFTADAEL